MPPLIQSLISPEMYFIFENIDQTSHTLAHCLHLFSPDCLVSRQLFCLMYFGTVCSCLMDYVLGNYFIYVPFLSIQCLYNGLLCLKVLRVL